jgi:hypothetical protein
MTTVRVRDLGFMAAAWTISIGCAVLNRIDDRLGLSERYARRAKERERRRFVRLAQKGGRRRW